MNKITGHSFTDHNINTNDNLWMIIDDNPTAGQNI